jgi:hypothetical protein
MNEHVVVVQTFRNRATQEFLNRIYLFAELLISSAQTEAVSFPQNVMHHEVNWRFPCNPMTVKPKWNGREKGAAGWWLKGRGYIFYFTVHAFLWAPTVIFLLKQLECLRISWTFSLPQEYFDNQLFHITNTDCRLFHIMVNQCRTAYKLVLILTNVFLKWQLTIMNNIMANLTNIGHNLAGGPIYPNMMLKWNFTSSWQKRARQKNILCNILKNWYHNSNTPKEVIIIWSKCHEQEGNIQ